MSTAFGSKGVGLLLPPLSSVAGVDATSDALALVFISRGAHRVRVFAAVSWRLLLDGALQHVPPPPVALTALRLSESGSLLACADDTGGLHVFRIDATRATRLFGRKLALPANALAWCSDEQLASGDAHGEVRLWHHAATESHCQRRRGTGDTVADEELRWLAEWAEVTEEGSQQHACEEDSGSIVLLPAESSPIVQLDCGPAGLLVSTWVKTLLVPLPSGGAHASAKAIGKAKRDGPLGACFLSGAPALSICPDAAIAAARPRGRLWLVDADGAVLSTLRLLEADASAAVATTSGAAGNSTCCFGRLAPLASLGCLISWGEAPATDKASRTGWVSLIDLDGVRVLAAHAVTPPVHAIACLGLAEAQAADTEADSSAPAELDVLVLHGEPRVLTRIQLSGVPTRAHDATLRPAGSLAAAPSAHTSGPSVVRAALSSVSVANWGEAVISLSLNVECIGSAACSPGVGVMAGAALPVKSNGQYAQPEFAAAAVLMNRRMPAPMVAPPGDTRAQRRVSIVRDIQRHCAGGIECAAVSTVASTGAAPPPPPPLSWSAGLSMALESCGACQGSEHHVAAIASNDPAPTALATSNIADDGVGVTIALGQVPEAPTPDALPAVSCEATPRPSPRIAAWLRGDRHTFGLVALLLVGWSRRWRDGVLVSVLRRHACRLQLAQWTPLLALASQMDSRRAAVKEQHRRVPACVLPRDGHDAGAALSPPLGACATLLVLRAMLGAQPPAICLGVLRAQPALATCLPPCGYVELLHAVQRANATTNSKQPQDAA